MHSSRTTLPIWIPFFCLFLSGCASLVYELVWIRQLVLVFGGTLYAISAVLCAFMTGLALGAWGISLYLNRPDPKGRSRNLVLLYGVIEGLIGLYGLFFPFGLDLLSRVYPLLLGGSLESGPLLHWIEFVLSTLLMLPATFLMGATLPIIGSWAIGDRGGKLFSNVSVLYSLNTFGAVFGCLFAQTAGIRYLGVTGTTWSAVALNFVVLLLCLAWRESPAPQEGDDRSPFARPVALTPNEGNESLPSRRLSFLLLFIFMYSGMVALASEILWARILVFPMGSTLYSFALILATFLFGIALGSLVAEKIPGNSKWILKFLAVELCIGLFCLGILPLFDHLADWTARADHLFYDLENTSLKTLLVRSLFGFGLMFLPTLGFGLIFPLANRVHLSLFGTISRTLGNTYAVNTVGAVLGTILTPFLFVPLWGIQLSLFIIFSVLVILSVVGLALYLDQKRIRFAFSLAAAGLLVYGGYAWSTPTVSTDRLGDHNFARVEINIPKERLKLLDYKEGNFATLNVVEDIETGARTLYVNGFSTATVSNSVGGSAYMQAMGFVPMALHPHPQRALVIGFGTGNTAGTVSLFPGVQADAVEIDRNVLSLAHWFKRWNHDVLHRPNTRIIVQDGRTFVRWADTQYDVITLEPMSPVQAGVTNLYSREFYELARRRLNPDGLVMQWLPLHLVGPEDARSIIKTFQEVFPHTSVWNSFLTRIVLLVGSNQPVPLDKNRFEALMRVPELRDAARQMGLYSFIDFMDFYLTEGARVKPLLTDAGIITDDRPTLEYSPVTLVPPLLWQTDESFLNLLRYRIGRFPPVTGISPEEETSFRRAFEIRTAQRVSVFAQRYHGPGEPAFAVKNYPAGMEAMRIYLETIQDRPISLKDARWGD